MADLPYIGTTITGPSGNDSNDFELKVGKGAPNGYAPLDANAKVPTANLPDQASLDAEVDAKITTHNSATTSVHGIANTANLSLVGHTHAISDVTNLQTTLATKSPLAGVQWTARHTTSTGNQYAVGSIVYHNGRVYRCLATNDSIEPIPMVGNPYWADLGGGYLLPNENPKILGGSIDTRAGAVTQRSYEVPTGDEENPFETETETSQAGGSNGNIILKGGDGGFDELDGGVGGNAGSINTSGGIGIDGRGGNGGSILLVGGSDTADAGSINLSGGESVGNGGSIISTGNEDNYNGGTLNMSAGDSGHGGSISLENKGGSINLSGHGGSSGGSITLRGDDDGNGGTINGSNNGGSIEFRGNSGRTGGSINLNAGDRVGQSSQGYGGSGGMLQLKGANGSEEENLGNGGNGGTIIGNGGQAPIVGTDENGAILGSGFNAGTINFSAGINGAGGNIDISNGGGSINTSGNDGGAGGSINTSSGGGSINTSGGNRGAGGSINLSNGGGSLIATTGTHFRSQTNANGGDAGGSGTINLSGGDATDAANPQDRWAYQVVLTTVGFDSAARGTYVRSANRETFVKTTNTGAFPQYFISESRIGNQSTGIPLFTLFRNNSSSSSTVLCYNRGSASFNTNWYANSNGSGSVVATGFATVNGYGQNGGSGGSLLMAGGDGSAPLLIPSFAGGSAGTINTSADNLGHSGGYINTSGNEVGSGGFINTSGGGSINTSNGGGFIDTTGGGSINLSAGGGSINLSGNGSIGGSIKSIGGTPEMGDNPSQNSQSPPRPAGSGGSIDLSCSLDPKYSDATGGSINLVAGQYGRAGNISSYGGYGDNNERGGDLNMSGKSRRGGDILTYGGDWDYSEDGYGLGAEGGDILTYGGQYAGGSINTSNGGGSINTKGFGSIQLGVAGIRTTLNGYASVGDKTITLPNATGTIALTNDVKTIFMLGGEEKTSFGLNTAYYYGGQLTKASKQLAAVFDSGNPTLGLRIIGNWTIKAIVVHENLASSAGAGGISSATRTYGIMNLTTGGNVSGIGSAFASIKDGALFNVITTENLSINISSGMNLALTLSTSQVTGANLPLNTGTTTITAHLYCVPR